MLYWREKTGGSVCRSGECSRRRNFGRIANSCVVLMLICGLSVDAERRCDSGDSR